jgi:hypothetical protein
VALAGALTIGVLRSFPRPIDVPGRSGGIEWILAPVLPAAIAALVPPLLRRTYQPMERLSGRVATVGRLSLLGLLFVVSFSSIVLGVGAIRFADGRNCALALAVAVLSMHTVPVMLSWTPVVGFGIVTWLLGVPPSGENPPTWAVLLQPGSSVDALVTTIVLSVAAVAVFVARTPSHDDIHDDIHVD